jgi:branched-chain amino acid transport system permease protein
LVIAFVAVLAGLAAIPAVIAKRKGRNPVLWFLAGLAFFLPALIASLVIADESRPRRPCPHCLEPIPYGAGVCSFCGRDVPTMPEPRDRQKDERRRRTALSSASRARITTALLIVLAIVLPLVSTLQYQQVLLLIGTFSLLALGLNVVVGLAGLLDLGYVAFFATGAYTAGILLDASPVDVPDNIPVWVVFPVAMIITMLVGVILGAPVLRLRGDYLAIVTLGFGEIVRIVANNLDGVTRGARGLNGIPGPVLFGYDFKVDPMPYYYLTLVIILLACFFLRRIERSRIGRAWIAIREDEVAAEAMGVSLLRAKLLAFAIGAGTASYAGVIQATNLHYVSPRTFTVFISVLILCQVVLGGLGSMLGAIVGSVVIWGLPEVMRDLDFISEELIDEGRFLIFGLLLVVMMIFRPQGLVPSKRRSREFAQQREEATHSGVPQTGESS